VPASLEDTLDGLLPQTQCTRCGFAGCRPYAAAMASGAAGPDQCPPGGADTVAALAGLLHLTAGPVNPQYGTEGPPRVAVIDEGICIGCAKCLPACPVDAIIGARRMLHTVVAGECNGCELCLPPCPVDCIVMVAVAPEPLPLEEIRERANHYRARHDAHQSREAARTARRAAHLSAHRPVGDAT
jgi:electron transport complex protein RnfB